MEEVASTEPIAGVKRPLEEPEPPPGLPGAPNEAAAAPTEDAPPAASAALPAGTAAPTGGIQTAEQAEEAALQAEAGWLRQQNQGLQTQLAQLQQQHQALTAAAQQAQHHQQLQAPAPAPTPSLRHNQAWTEQVNPENNTTYYWNSQTGESTYTRPADFNPGAANASASVGGPQTKGPPGANLFVVRKMRRGEYDEFNDEDLRREFGKYGTVTRAEMTIDKENGWSKGFGFVSYATVDEADAAMQVRVRELVAEGMV